MVSPILSKARNAPPEAPAPDSTPLEAFARDVARRRDALGTPVVMPRNDGTRRTPQKRALLAAIANTRTRW